MRTRAARWQLAAVVAIALVFLALNWRAYDGFFQDDELDNLSWAPHVRAMQFVLGFLKPLFDVGNFRPPGHLYFALMGRTFGENFPPWMTPILAIHLLNGVLLFLVLRQLRAGAWQALAGVAFFVLSAGAMDAYWKPMYVFDLLCTLFCLASVLFYARRQWVLSFVAFWCAYKSKELAVMLPVVLLAWEHWFGERRYWRLTPFVLVSISFGVQGLLFNPNKDNAYTFRFTWAALRATAPFYAQRFGGLGGVGLLVTLMVAARDRRVWLGLLGTVCFLFPLVFLPGRLFEAYAYLPLAFVTVAMVGAATLVRPVWIWAALLLWMPFNVHRLRVEQAAKLRLDDEAFGFVSALNRWAVLHPTVKTLVYARRPGAYEEWGVAGAWNIAHGASRLPVWFDGTGEATRAMDGGTVGYVAWDPEARRFVVTLRAPKPVR